jgi:hypothetical protein
MQTLLEIQEEAREARVDEFNQAQEVFGSGLYNDEWWDPNEFDRSWLFSLQVMSRWAGWWAAVGHHSKAQATWATLPDNIGEVTFFEAIMTGPCKASEYLTTGCWAQNSNILPYIERFTFGVEWKQGTEYFELDQFALTDVVTDVLNGTKYFPRLKILSSETKLHCTFVEHPIDIPSTVPTIDVRTVKLADLSTTSYNTTTVNFNDLDLRRKPKYLMIYCKRKRTDHARGEYRYIMSDKSASIMRVKLRTDIHPEALDVRSRQHVDAITLRNFPQYQPPLRVTGNIFCIAINELPARKNVAIEYNHLHGEIDVQQDWHTSSPLQYGVYISLFYTDTYFSVDKNYVTGKLDLYDMRQ